MSLAVADGPRDALCCTAVNVKYHLKSRLMSLKVSEGCRKGHNLIGHVSLFRSTPPSRPNKVCLKCPYVRPSVRPQKLSSIAMKFGM